LRCFLSLFWLFQDVLDVDLSSLFIIEKSHHRI
jgi:hypothetical protein